MSANEAPAFHALERGKGAIRAKVVILKKFLTPRNK